MKNERANVKRLIKIHDAIAGMCSEEEDPFGHFYEGGADALMADLESVLQDCGVEIRQPEYCVVPYKRNGEERWGICSDPADPKGSWVLTGFRSSEDACAELLNKEVFPDFEGKPRVLA